MKAKDIIAGVLAVFLIVVVCLGTKIQSVDDYYLTHLDDITEDSETVFLEIRCDTILDNWEMLDESLRYEKYVPSDGIILIRTEYVLRKGDSVFDVLNRAVRHNRIAMAYQGADFNAYNSIYVQGLNQLFEFSCGALSGWMYKVNEWFPNYGCDNYDLKDGDEIVWSYTCDLGRDVGGEFWQPNK